MTCERSFCGVFMWPSVDDSIIDKPKGFRVREQSLRRNYRFNFLDQFYLRHWLINSISSDVSNVGDVCFWHLSTHLNLSRPHSSVQLSLTTMNGWQPEK